MTESKRPFPWPVLWVVFGWAIALEILIIKDILEGRA